MSELHDYLRGAYESDKGQVRIVEDLINKAVPVFWLFWDQQHRTWPYAVRVPKNGKAELPKNFSASTHTMILFALEALAGSTERTPLFPATRRPIKHPKNLAELEKIRSAATDKLVNEVKRSAGKVYSGTFGRDDPFTLTWLTELCVQRGKSFESIRNRVLRAGRRTLARAGKEELLEWDEGDQAGLKKGVIEHSFLHLRRIHLAKARSKLLEENPTYAAEKSVLEERVRAQLAYSVIRDSRFDPAELTFGLEGLLQIDPLSVSENEIDCILSVLESSQSRDPYWRPVNPFIGTAQGMVSLPVSVEVANSLLRCCVLLGDQLPALVSRLEPRLRRYCQWLQARLVTSHEGPVTFVGWHSEHVNQRDLIHLWETSQVVLFLLQYRSMLHEKIALEGLRAAGLSPKPSKDIDTFPNYWEDEPLGGAALDQPSQYLVLATGKERYLSGLQNKRTTGSILLYGPPGTGKTTLAEQLAVRLSWPLLTITVSDFLAGGAAEVEARAKGIFRILCEQRDLVILLDEIDQFLLDRNSEAYRKQTGIFQFMTPGMLTKLQDLRDQKQCIFIIATNYYERIDSAIKRRGRIDDHLLLTLPGKDQRLKLLRRFLKEDAEGALQNNEAREFDRLAEEMILPKADKTLIEKTVFFGYGDLMKLVKQAVFDKDRRPRKLVEALLKVCDKVEPAVKLSSYSGRFPSDDSLGDGPFEEFLVLLDQLAELGTKLEPLDQRRKTILDVLGKEWTGYVENHVHDEKMKGRLKNWLGTFLADASQQGNP